MSKGDIIYWARIIPTIDYAEVIELKIRTVHEDWFVGVDKDTKQAFLFNNDTEVVFNNRTDALMVVKAYEEDAKKHNLTEEYEEY